MDVLIKYTFYINLFLFNRSINRTYWTLNTDWASQASEFLVELATAAAVAEKIAQFFFLIIFIKSVR